jgi:hypothetical protein
LVILAFISSLATGLDMYRSHKEEDMQKHLEQEKLKYVAIGAKGAISPIIEFLWAFLRSADKEEEMKLFIKGYKIEPGKDIPPPQSLDQIMEVFSKTSFFKPSNTSIFNPSNKSIHGKAISWFQKLYQNIKQSKYECDHLLKQYGGMNHSIIMLIDDLRIRSDQLLFLMESAKMIPELFDMWKVGVPNQHIDFFRHYFLRISRANSMVKEILGDEYK